MTTEERVALMMLNASMNDHWVRNDGLAWSPEDLSYPHLRRVENKGETFCWLVDPSPGHAVKTIEDALECFNVLCRWIER